MPTKKKRTSQYEHVQSILTRLQGSSIPSYQGLGAFWMDYEAFTTASLYGQRLIAPAPGSGEGGMPSGCCGSSSQPMGRPTSASKGGCCGGGGSEGDGTGTSENPVTDPAVAAVQEPPTQTFIGDCWPSGGPGGNTGGGGSGTSNARSSQSAIVIGLKGEYPFDDSIFPPLLWDTPNKPTADDIKTIATWIDSGCPETDSDEDTARAKVIGTRNDKVALANGDMTHPVSIGKTNTYQKSNKDISIRKEISSLTEAEVTTYREALACMYTYNDFWQDNRSFDLWARIHANSCQHGWEQFGPWHRIYLYFFEQQLQDYDESITLPYWDWTEYAAANRTTFNNTKLDIGVLPERFGCFLTAKGLAYLKAQTADGKALFTKKQISNLESIHKKGTTYNSGLRFLTAAGVPYNLINKDNTGVATWGPKVTAVYNALRADNPLWFPNRWPGAVGAAIGGPAMYPTTEDIDILLDLDVWNDFGGGPPYDHHFGSLEMVHNGMHNFSGGSNPNHPSNSPKWAKIYADKGLIDDPQSKENPPAGWMTDNRTTAFDPIFWSHHANVDRLWAEWQKKHSGQPEELDGVLAPWTMTVKDSLSTKKLGYKYVRHYVHYKVANDVGVVKFKSADAKASAAVLDKHKRLEVKIHRVQRGNLPNATIRVFLNAPDADINTPLENNDHFVQQVSLFHGTCFGGPGHCNLPLDKTRKFDHRSIHHHEPRNIVINATKTVQTLLNNGAKDISVQLVVLGIHGKPIDNALFIDGVSLNFID